jgi:hypothetical protein
MLNNLREARVIRDLYRAQVDAVEAPYKQAMRDASSVLRARLREAEALHNDLNDACQATYAAQDAQRGVLILAGAEPPPVPVPHGCTVRCSWIAVVTDVDALPRDVLAPDMAAVKAALQGGGVPGAALAPKFSFVFA